MATGTKSATYDYNAFGETIQSEGVAALANPFRFSTKYTDDETGLLYYGFRYYQPQTGRWINRDPSEEENGINLYGMVANDPINTIDPFGLWATGVHHAIVEDWLDSSYEKYAWCCCTLNVRALIKQGSDNVDGVFSNGWPSFGWLAAQSSAKANEHGMARSGQSVPDAKASYDTFIRFNEDVARILADRARSANDCAQVKKALVSLGRAFHPFTDELSPAHEGFQTWYGPIDGLVAMGPKKYYEYIKQHEAKETVDDYKRVKGPVIDAVKAEFQGRLDAILKNTCGAK